MEILTLVFWLLMARLDPYVQGQGSPIQEKQPTPATPSTPSTFLNNFHFAFNLYRQMVAKNPYQNFVFSPLNFSIPLTLLALQARPEIRTEILEGLGWNITQVPEDRAYEHYSQLLRALLPHPGQCQLDTGSMLFMDENSYLVDKFVDTAQSLYHTEAVFVPFRDHQAAREMMDRFISRKTRGQVENLAQEIRPNVVMILVNYMLIREKWKFRFNRKLTRTDDFYAQEDLPNPISMMQRLGWFQVRRLHHLHSYLLRLPFSCNVTAVFLLPDLGRMEEVEEALLAQDVNTWTQAIPLSRRRLFMPKFSISWDVQLDQLLPTLGISKIFSDFSSVSGITALSVPTRVSWAVHTAMLTMDEKGAEEEDITDFRNLPKAFLPHLRLDKPFLFLILEESSRSLLLLGKVINPLINLQSFD